MHGKLVTLTLGLLAFLTTAPADAATKGSAGNPWKFNIKQGVKLSPADASPCLSYYPKSIKMTVKSEYWGSGVAPAIQVTLYQIEGATTNKPGKKVKSKSRLLGTQSFKVNGTSTQVFSNLPSGESNQNMGYYIEVRLSRYTGYWAKGAVSISY